MPIFRKSQLANSTSLGIWKIEETPENLRRNLKLNQAENKYYETLRSDLRKKHWLSYRNLLKSLMDKNSREIFYDVYGKPHSVNKNYHLSVAHSGTFSAAIVSSETPVGIDIEMIKDRIERVKGKFLSEKEGVAVGQQNRLEKLYIYWGAKESLYKLHGKPEVEFIRDISVYDFDYSPDGKGVCTAKMKTPFVAEDYSVFYEKIDDYMLVYAFRLLPH
jgi:4'-phosphopantetheinyl transferase